MKKGCLYQTRKLYLRDVFILRSKFDQRYRMSQWIFLHKCMKQDTEKKSKNQTRPYNMFNVGPECQAASELFAWCSALPTIAR